MMDLETIKNIAELVGAPAVVWKVWVWGKKRIDADKLSKDQHRKLLLDKMDEQSGELKKIKYQLYPNGGMSMLDQMRAGLAELKAGQENSWELLDLAVWLSDKDGRVTFVTNSLCEMIGCTPDDVYDNSWVNRVMETQRDYVFQSWQRSVTNASEFNMTYSYRKSDGFYQTVNAVAVHNKDDKGKVISSAGRFTKQGEPFKV